MPNGVDYWRDLHDPFWRCERGHRLVPAHVRLCDSGGILLVAGIFLLVSIRRSALSRNL